MHMPRPHPKPTEREFPGMRAKSWGILMPTPTEEKLLRHGECLAFPLEEHRACL